MPDVSIIEGICKVLNISANMLLGIEESKIVEVNNVIMEQDIKNHITKLSSIRL